MIVFKHAIRAVWKNKFAIFVYGVLFAILVFSAAKESEGASGYSEPKIYVTIDDRANDAVSRTIKTYFKDDYVSYMHAGEDKKRLMTSVSETNLCVTIHPSAENWIAKNPQKAISIYHTEEESGIEASYAVNELVGYMKAYAPHFDKAIEMMNTKAQATLISDGKGEGLGNFYKLVGFFLTAIIMFNIGLVNISIYEKSFYKRSLASPITALRYDGEVFLTQGLVALLLVIVMVSSLSIAIPRLRQDALVTGFVFFVYAISILGMVNLLTALSEKRQAVAAMTNVISMLLATTGGAFIPSDMLPKWMIHVSRAFPFYYFGKTAGNHIYDRKWYMNIAIMILFGAFYFIVQTLIQKKKRVAE